MNLPLDYYEDIDLIVKNHIESYLENNLADYIDRYSKFRDEYIEESNKRITDLECEVSILKSEVRELRRIVKPEEFL